MAYMNGMDALSCGDRGAVGPGLGDWTDIINGISTAATNIFDVSQGVNPVTGMPANPIGTINPVTGLPYAYNVNPITSSPFGGMNLTTLLLIGVGIYLLMRK